MRSPEATIACPSARPGRGRRIAAGILAAFAAFAAAGLAAALAEATYFRQLVIFTSLPGILALSICALRFARRPVHIFRPSTAVLLGFAVFFIPEVYLGRSLFYPHPGSEDMLVKAGLLVWGGFGAFILGGVLPRLGTLERGRGLFQGRVTPGRVVIFAGALAVVGAFALLLLCRELGVTPWEYLKGFYTAEAWGGLTPSTRPLLLAGNFATAAGILCTWAVWRRDLSPGSRFAAWAILFFPLLLNTLRGTRGTLALLILCLFLSWIHRDRGRTRSFLAPRVRRATALLAVVLYLVLLGITWTRETAWGEKKAPAGEVSSVLASFSYFNRLLLTVETIPDREPFLQGRTFAAAFLFPVPRALWPQKPYGFGTVVAAWYGFEPGTVGIPATLIGELYANFQCMGVFLGMLLLGWLLKHLDGWGAGVTPGGILVLACAVNLWYAFGMLRGDFYTAFSGWAFHAACLAAAARLCRSRSPAPCSTDTRKSTFAHVHPIATVR